MINGVEVVARHGDVISTTGSMRPVRGPAFVRSRSSIGDDLDEVQELEAVHAQGLSRNEKHRARGQEAHASSNGEKQQCTKSNPAAEVDAEDDEQVAHTLRPLQPLSRFMGPRRHITDPPARLPSRLFLSLDAVKWDTLSEAEELKDSIGKSWLRFTIMITNSAFSLNTPPVG